MTAHPLDAEARRRRAHAAVDRLHERLLAHDMSGFADVWAPDGTMEFPFAPPNRPQRLHGREAVRDYLRDYTKAVDLTAITAQTRHETQDPDTLVVEFSVDGTALATGLPYQISYVAVITVGEQGITAYRDYWNPLAAGHALGVLDDMVAGYPQGGAA